MSDLYIAAPIEYAECPQWTPQTPWYGGCGFKGRRELNGAPCPICRKEALIGTIGVVFLEERPKGV